MKSIAVIGLNADTGMISGGGSAQVDPPGRMPIEVAGACVVPDVADESNRGEGAGRAGEIRSGQRSGGCGDAGEGLRCGDRVRVPVGKRRHGPAIRSSLPDNQDALIAQVAAANPRTIVVLEIGHGGDDAVAR